MPKMRLTAIGVERINPPSSGRVEYFDTAFPGFALRVTDKGSKSWVLFYRLGGRQRRLTLGTYPALGLADAHKAAKEALREVVKGNDPALMRAEAKHRRRDTVADVAELFVERHARRKNRSWRETQRIMNKYVKPVWGKRPADSIARRDVIELLDEIADRAPVQANLVLAAIRKMFNWCVERDILAASPVAGVKPPTKVVARDRVLTDDEIVVVWRAFDEMTFPFGPLFKFLLITGQRRNEVGQLRWRDINLEKRMWTLPRQFTKADRAHEVPLSDLAVEVIESVPRFKGEEYVFTGRTGNPVSGYSKAKARADAQSGVEAWRLHDLRRTMASGMARLGVAPHVVEKVLNHAGGTISGVAAVYNRHGYLDEKRHALDAWASHLETVVHGTVADNVVALSADL